MMPILPTTILPDGTLDLVSQRRLVRYALACGTQAVGHLGGASEFYKLTMADRTTLIETVLVEVDSRVPVFVGVTGPSTRVAVELARHAESLGADLLMLAMPYVTIPDLAGTRAHIEAVCSAVSVPVILQDTAASDQILTPEVTVELFDEIPNLACFKADGRNFLDKTARLLQLAGNAIEIIGGLGGKHMIHMLKLGITSFMTGTEALDLHTSCVHAYLDGNSVEAERIYDRQIAPYFAFYDSHPDELLKRMLHWRGLIDHPEVIPPLPPARISAAEWAAFESVLTRLDWRTDCSNLIDEPDPGLFSGSDTPEPTHQISKER
ncbi:MAG: dihydrodipicolinate synthase family protein [Propionicimonas sp.]|nr:dihydrodipicolinate synthase family protein [Propionicimonas sp.]